MDPKIWSNPKFLILIFFYFLRTLYSIFNDVLIHKLDIGYVPDNLYGIHAYNKNRHREVSVIINTLYNSFY